MRRLPHDLNELLGIALWGERLYARNVPALIDHLTLNWMDVEIIVSACFPSMASVRVFNEEGSEAELRPHAQVKRKL